MTEIKRYTLSYYHRKWKNHKEHYHKRITIITIFHLAYYIILICITTEIAFAIFRIKLFVIKIIINISFNMLKHISIKVTYNVIQKDYKFTLYFTHNYKNYHIESTTKSLIFEAP